MQFFVMSSRSILFCSCINLMLLPLRFYSGHEYVIMEQMNLRGIRIRLIQMKYTVRNVAH
uniref:Uncharacterized protein n=1 Tax=Arundo donax TaxID=35708 RepID=A0A0A8YK11_ARUDO